MLADILNWYLHSVSAFWGDVLRLGVLQILLVVLAFWWLGGRGRCCSGLSGGLAAGARRARRMADAAPGSAACAAAAVLRSVATAIAIRVARPTSAARSALAARPLAKILGQKATDPSGLRTGLPPQEPRFIPTGPLRASPLSVLARVCPRTAASSPTSWRSRRSGRPPSRLSPPQRGGAPTSGGRPGSGLASRIPIRPGFPRNRRGAASRPAA